MPKRGKSAPGAPRGSASRTTRNCRTNQECRAMDPSLPFCVNFQCSSSELGSTGAIGIPDGNGNGNGDNLDSCNEPGGGITSCVSCCSMLNETECDVEDDLNPETCTPYDGTYYCYWYENQCNYGAAGKKGGKINRRNQMKRGGRTKPKPGRMTRGGAARGRRPAPRGRRMTHGGHAHGNETGPGFYQNGQEMPPGYEHSHTFSGQGSHSGTFESYGSGATPNNAHTHGALSEEQFPEYSPGLLHDHNFITSGTDAGQGHTSPGAHVHGTDWAQQHMHRFQNEANHSHWAHGNGGGGSAPYSRKKNPKKFRADRKKGGKAGRPSPRGRGRQMAGGGRTCGGMNQPPCPGGGYRGGGRMARGGRTRPVPRGRQFQAGGMGGECPVGTQRSAYGTCMAMDR